MQILRPHQNLLNQKRWGGVQQSVLYHTFQGVLMCADVREPWPTSDRLISHGLPSRPWQVRNTGRRSQIGVSSGLFFSQVRSLWDCLGLAAAGHQCHYTSQGSHWTMWPLPSRARTHSLSSPCRSGDGNSPSCLLQNTALFLMVPLHSTLILVKCPYIWPSSNSNLDVPSGIFTWFTSR